MRKELPEIVEKGRITKGPLASKPGSGMNGAYEIIGPVSLISVIASNGGGWEHVSVSVSSRPDILPGWEEMCFVKDLFWRPEECVLQYHPSEEDYVNIHPSVLHLWRPIDQEIPKPLKIMV
jgi:hypothetical protein